MTKAAYIEEQMNKPCGAAGLEKMRRIVKDRTFGKVNEVAIDTFTAGRICSIYDALGEEHKAKLLAMPVWKVVNVCLKIGR